MSWLDDEFDAHQLQDYMNSEEKPRVGKNLGHIHFLHNDGGRWRYFKGEKAGDCVTRAIAIASGKDYKEIYDDLFALNRKAASKNTKLARKIKKDGISPRDGVMAEIYQPYIIALGFEWVSCSGIGKGISIHLREDELPKKGKLILRLSRHLAAYKDGTLHDTYDCSRGGTRGVYGYWIKRES